MNRVEFYRSQCPEDYDPQDIIATTTLLVAALVVAAASAAAGAYSSVAASNAQQQSAKFNAAVARNNETVATQQAQFQADRIRDRNRRIIAAGRTDLLKSGVTESGSVQDLLLDSTMQGELDRTAAIYTGQISAGTQSAQSSLEMSKAQWAKTAGYIGVGSSILSGAGNATTIASQPQFRN